MKILTGDKIKQSIAACKPFKIAVAYIGQDWRQFLRSPERLETIICSPTLGSNPNAIQEIANLIGWEKVEFLDELHAKMYLGKKYGIIGSANLTLNGLSGERLLEACVEMHGQAELSELGDIFEKILGKAQALYSSTEEKMAKLADLEHKRNRARVAGLTPTTGKKSSNFKHFQLLSDNQFYVGWYWPVDDVEYSENMKKMKELIVNEMHFAEDDKLDKFKWILMWKANNDGNPDMRAKPSWLFIHDLIKNGVISDKRYPNCALQRNDLEVPAQPFEITRDVADALKKSLRMEHINKHFFQKHQEVHLMDRARKGLPMLIEEMMKRLRPK